MGRFKKLSQMIWHCQYHIVWVPKYRFRISSGQYFKVDLGVRFPSHTRRYRVKKRRIHNSCFKFKIALEALRGPGSVW